MLVGDTSELSFSIHQLVNFESTLVQTGSGSEVTGSVLFADQWGDGSAFVQCAGSGAIANIQINAVNNGDVAATNTRLATIPGGNQFNEVYIHGGQISVIEAVQWAAADANLMYIFCTRFDGGLDYANGQLNVLYPGLVANSNQAALSPATPSDNTQFLNGGATAAFSIP